MKCAMVDEAIFLIKSREGDVVTFYGAYKDKKENAGPEFAITSELDGSDVYYCYDIPVESVTKFMEAYNHRNETVSVFTEANPIRDKDGKVVLQDQYILPKHLISGLRQQTTECYPAYSKSVELYVDLVGWHTVSFKVTEMSFFMYIEQEKG